MSEGGVILRVSGPTVVAKNMAGARIHNRVLVGEDHLPGEVIRLEADQATIQVYEDTTGLGLGEGVADVGKPLLAELGPGLLGSVYDGVQRPLHVIRAKSGDFIGRGQSAPPLLVPLAFLTDGPALPTARDGPSALRGLSECAFPQRCRSSRCNGCS